MKRNTACQSCGMPFKKGYKNGGINADGSKNTLYCRFCYHAGTFTYITNDVKEFQENCRINMVDGGCNKIAAWLFTRGMSRLGRWK